MTDDHDDDVDSLFGSEASSLADLAHDLHNQGDEQPIASRLPPSIPGLFFSPDLLSRDLHDHVLVQVAACGYFALEDDVQPAASELSEPYKRSPRNQAMLFARSLPTDQSPTSQSSSDCAGLPAWAVELIQHLRTLLLDLPEHELPSDVKNLLFPTDELLSRQLILNLYNGAEGLAPHVDLVNRFADGILLCSFGPQNTGTVMDFTHASQGSRHLFLPSGSVLLLSGEARFDWRHGITARDEDRVYAKDGTGKVELVKRSIRLSITIRSMLPGADVVGE